jgi:hypothetical protein
VRIEQPRLPTVTYTVSSYEVGRAFSWQASSPGALTVADHEVEPRGVDASAVTLRITQTGLIGGLVARLLRAMVRRYVDMEAAGLKSRSEDPTPERHG